MNDRANNGDIKPHPHINIAIPMMVSPKKIYFVVAIIMAPMTANNTATAQNKRTNHIQRIFLFFVGYKLFY